MTTQSSGDILYQDELNVGCTVLLDVSDGDIRLDLHTVKSTCYTRSELWKWTRDPRILFSPQFSGPRIKLITDMTHAVGTHVTVVGC